MRVGNAVASTAAVTDALVGKPVLRYTLQQLPRDLAVIHSLVPP